MLSRLNERREHIELLRECAQNILAGLEHPTFGVQHVELCSGLTPLLEQTFESHSLQANRRLCSTVKLILDPH
jgi:hypothetical protein